MKTPNLPKMIAALIESGFTQKQIADLTGCTQSNISQIVTGKSGTTRPAWELVSKVVELAARYGINEAGVKKRKK